jgi:hypothetical protein
MGTELFTSEDNVLIYIGDEVYATGNNYIISGPHVITEHWDKTTSDKFGMKYFKHKSSVEHFIKYNKKRLSLMELEKIFKQNAERLSFNELLTIIENYEI